MPASVISEILAAGREMLAHPVEIAAACAGKRWSGLPADYRLVLITKGDLFDQERKVARVGAARAVRGRGDRQRQEPRDL